MKDFVTKPITIAFLFFGIVFFQACQNSENQKLTNNHFEHVPKLQDRSEKIQLGVEWDYVQNHYSELASKIQENPKDHMASLQMAELFIKEARVTGEHGHYYPAALEMTERIIGDKSAPEDVKFMALTTKAGVQLSLHEFETAHETAKKAITLNDKNAQIHGVLVDCYVEMGDYEKAVKMADKMISIKPDIRSYSRISYLREIHGDVDGAIEAMQYAVKSGYPGNEETAWAMLTLGEMHQRYGDLEQAEKIYQEILTIRENYPFAISALGSVYHEMNDLEKAEEYQKRAIDIIPEVGYYISLAHIYKEQGRTEEMNSLVTEIFEMLEDDVTSGHNMNMEYADLYLNLLEKPDKALEYANIEYAKRPENIDVNQLLAEILYEKGEAKQTQEYLAVANKTGAKTPSLIKLNEKLGG